MHTSNIKAVLFDVDGVLVDSFEAGLHFVGDILEHMGRARPTRHELRKAFHLPLPLALQALSKAELTEELERLHEIIPKIRYRYDLLREFPHTQAMMNGLKTRYALGLVTNRTREGLKRYFNFSKNERLFDVLVTSEDVTHPKPNPAPLLLAAKRLTLSPADCVYVGDSQSDVEAGKAAGMKVVFYGRKKNPAADATIASFKLFPDILSSLR